MHAGRYYVQEYERFPTLGVDDMSWAEPENRDALDQANELHEIPVGLVKQLDAAQKRLRVAEDAIYAHLGWRRL